MLYRLVALVPAVLLALVVVTFVADEVGELSEFLSQLR